MRRILPFSILVFSIPLVLCEQAASDCTIGVASGTVTDDARPLLWKSRMWRGCPDNQVVHFSASPYDYIGIRNSGATYPEMGVNSAGLCTGNSLVGDAEPEDGPFTQHILQNFATVDEVRNYIQQELAAGTLRVGGCFPIMDADGNAVIFEINTSQWFLEYDVTNPARTDQGLLGWIVRANEFHDRPDGTDDTSIAGRYEAGAYNIGGLVDGGLLSARTIMQGNDGVNGYEFMRYGPGRPLSTIAAITVCSSMVVRGVTPGEDPALATMWISLGHANYGIAVPTWVRVANVPEKLRHGDMAAIADSLAAAGNEAATQAKVLPFEASLFEQTELFLQRWRSVGIPSIEAMTRVETRMADDAYSLLFSLRASGYDNNPPTVAIDVTDMSNLSVHFTVNATDSDGDITRVYWNFGDGETSWADSPWHTYNALGEYLVSCTVMDNDGVNVTDWQYIKVPKGNSDGDNDIDLDDYAELPDCITGQGQIIGTQECEIFDFDCDNDVDLIDVMGFQVIFTGSMP